MQIDMQDYQKFCYFVFILVMVFFMGEVVFYVYYEYLGMFFVQFLLSIVEDGLFLDIIEQLLDFCVNLFLVFNLYLLVFDQNVIMVVLSKYVNVKIFFEKLLLFLNRGDDFVCIFRYELQLLYFVFKFLQDVFGSLVIVVIFYYIDMMVFIDIIVWYIVDLLLGDKLCMEYFFLMYVVVCIIFYLQYCYWLFDLQVIL